MIALGNKKPSAIKLGDRNVSAVYLGENKIWPAAIPIWEYTLSVPSDITFNASGDSQTLSIQSYKRRTINGTWTGEQIDVPYTTNITGPFSLNDTSIIIGNNTSINSRTGNITIIQEESGKEFVVNLIQQEGVKVFENPIIDVFEYESCAAMGGIKTPNIRYHQDWTWNGVLGSGETDTFTSADDRYTKFESVGSVASVDSYTGVVAWGVNPDATERSGSILVIITINGKTTNRMAVSNQEASIVTYDYEFSVSPSSLTFDIDGGTKTVSVISRKQKILNGTLTGIYEDVPWTTS